MSKKKHGTAWLVAIALALALWAPAAIAQEDPSEPADTRVEGEWPKRLKPVTLKLEDTTVVEALGSASSQAGLGLVVANTGDRGPVRLTLHLVRKPAREVIELLLRSGGMTGRIEGGILFIDEPAATDQRPEPSADMPAPALAPTPQAVPDVPTPEEPGADQAEAEEEESGPDGLVPGTTGGEDRNRHHGRFHHRKNERVQVGKSMTIEAGEEVDSAVVVGGSLTIAGHVLEDAVAVGGSVTLEPSAVVEGDAVAVGGTVDVQPGAELGGDRVGVGGPLGSIIADRFAGGDLPLGTIAMLHTLSKLMRVAVLFVVGLLIVSFAPRRYARTREYMIRKPGKSALAGAIIMIAVVPLSILFFATVIGIPLIPFVALGLMLLIVFGLTAFLTWLGDRIPLFKGRKTPVAALAIGVGIFFLVSLVPLVSSLILTLVSFFGAGAAFLSRLGAPPKDPPPETPSLEPASV